MLTHRRLLTVLFFHFIWAAYKARRVQKSFSFFLEASIIVRLAADALGIELQEFSRFYKSTGDKIILGVQCDCTLLYSVSENAEGVFQ
jgi:hypothetical protein